MSLVTPALLGGMLLIGLPIVLHLVMRQHPQRLSFPALRFVEKRRQTNQTRMQLRHLLLLLLRCGLIALLAIALARPTLTGSGKKSSAAKPVAAVLVFDNNLRMNYIHAGNTRLEAAQDLADWLLKQLPLDTPVAVLDRGSRFAGWSIDRSAAQLKAARVSTTASTVPLEETVAEAVRLLEEYEDHHQEIYLFSDLAQSTWTESCRNTIKGELKTLSDADLYLVDVGVEESTNLGLRPVSLSGDVIPAGGQLNIESSILGELNADQDDDAAPIVSLWLQPQGESEPSKRGEQIITPRSDGSPLGATLKFVVDALEEGTHQGYLQLSGNDPFLEDNRQYFTVEVEPPRQLLVAADTRRNATFALAALAPLPAVEGGLPPRILANFKPFSDLNRTDLIDYDGILLLDPPPLGTPTWQQLREFVEAGGGLGIALGRLASNARQELSQLPAADLMPAQLRWQSRDETFLRPNAFSHPLLKPLADYAQIIPWSNFPVFKYWELKDLGPGAVVIAAYANSQPALVEKNLGAGRVLVLTTPISDLPTASAWNLLPTASDPWPFVAIIASMADYLSGIQQQQLNYKAGETAYLRLAQSERTDTYAVRLPDNTALKQTLPPASSQIAVSSTSQVGNYRVVAGGSSRRLDRGFSINPSAEVSDLTRADPDLIRLEIDRERVHLAKSRREINVQFGIGRVGRELFPMLIFGVVILLAAEHFTANTFYR